MRFFTLLLLCSLFTAGLSGQKLKDEKFQIEFLRLPTKNWPDSARTFSVDFSKAGDNLRAAGLTETSYSKNVKLTDFKKVPYGHVQIIVSGGSYSEVTGKTTKHETKYKDKEGVEKTSVKYSYDITYTAPVSVVIKTHAGKVLIEKIVGASTMSATIGQRGKSKGGTHSTAAAATEAYKKGVASFKKNAVNKSVNSALSAAMTAFRAQYDLVAEKQALLFEIPSGKKVPNEAEWLGAATDAVAIAKEVKAMAPLGDLTNRMAVPIKFWEAELPKHDPTDKKQRKYYYAAAANLATANLIIEDGANAQKYADLLTDELKVKTYEAAQLKKKVAALVSQLAIPGYTSRHFPLPDRSEAEPPAAAAAAIAAAETAKIEKAKPKPKAPSMRYDTLTAYLIQEDGGEKIAGKIRLPKSKPLFKRYRKEIKFWNGDGEAVSLNPENVHELGFGQTILVTRDRPTGTTGLKKRASYLKVDTDAGPIRLLTLIPYYSDQDPIVTDFIDLPEEDKTMALAFSNARWINWRKSFAELFSDCPVLYAEIRVGYYKNNVKDVRRALNDYKNKPCE